MQINSQKHLFYLWFLLRNRLHIRAVGRHLNLQRKMSSVRPCLLAMFVFNKVHVGEEKTHAHIQHACRSEDWTRIPKCRTFSRSCKCRGRHSMVRTLCVCFRFHSICDSEQQRTSLTSGGRKLICPRSIKRSAFLQELFFFLDLSIIYSPVVEKLNRPRRWCRCQRN